VFLLRLQTQKFQNRLTEILDQISGAPAVASQGDTTQTASAASDDDEDEGLSISTRRASPQPASDGPARDGSVPVYEMQFPQLFVH
jgi:hypothetical protein